MHEAVGQMYKFTDGQISIHDFGHPYVKPATKKFTTFCPKIDINANTGTGTVFFCTSLRYFCFYYSITSPKNKVTFPDPPFFLGSKCRQSHHR